MDGWGGERQIGKTLQEIEPNHVYRYKIAAPYCTDAKVLDAACGCGYGSNILSNVAKSVLGVDYSKEAINYAMQHWKRPNIEFQQYDLTKLCYIDLGTFECIVSYETLEHLQVPIMETIKKFYDILKPNGILVASHPEMEMNKSRFHYHFRIDGKETKLKMELVGFGIIEDITLEGRTPNHKHHILVGRKYED